MMSDYLANLVARNLEVADRIEPRIASSFEPATGLQARRSPFQDSAVAEPIEQGVFVERSPDGQLAATSSPRRTPVINPPPAGAAPSVRDHLATPGPAAREQPPFQRNIDPTSARAHVDASAGSPGRPSLPLTEPTEPSPIVALPDPDDRRVEPALSRLAPAGPARVSPSALSASTSGPRETAGRRQVPPAQARTPPPFDVTVMVSPDKTVTAPVQRPTTAVNAEAGGTPRTILSNPTSDAEAGSREERSPARAIASASAVPSSPRFAESPHGAESSIPAASVHSVGAPSAVAVQVRLRADTVTDSLADPVLDSTVGTSGSVTAATVHVTIGRLEVKATPAQSAARTRPSAPASTSLDDYLRSRADGSGR